MFGRIIVLFMLVCMAACSISDNPVKFAIVSDLHAVDIPDGKDRLDSFITAASHANVDFIIELGDFCRLDSVSQPYLNIWDKFSGEKYHVIGNHDMDQYTPEEYVKGMGMKGRYYSFDSGDFHFVVLDGNNLFDGKEYCHYSKANYYVDAQMRAFMDPEQMEWLKHDLKSTEKRCVIFSHQSIDAAMRNGDKVRKILEDENQNAGFKKVVLAFSGHNHSNYTKNINGIIYMQINSASYVWIDEPSMTEKRYSEEINQKYSLLKYSITYDQPLYAFVTLTSKGAEVKGRKANFMPPTPKDLNMKDSLDGFPLVSVIEDVNVDF